MKPQVLLNIRSQIALLLASMLLITACSQQQLATSEADNGKIGGGDSSHNDNKANNGSSTNADGGGSSTHGANVGKGSNVKPTGTGSYGNNKGKGNANDGQSAAKKNAAITLENLKNPKSLLSKRIIYFDYDKATINPKYQAILNAHSTLLAKHSNVDIRLEGHADERGTREYNVALSEERAKAVEWIMRSKGVTNSQTEVIAYGEERPAIVGVGEKSWSKNRRVEIKYPNR